MEKARDFILKIFRLIMRPEMRILPGQLAFFTVITIIPLLALIGTITAALSISIETVRLAISDTVPTGIANIINMIIVGDGINFNIVIFYISTFILASNGLYSMINVSNEIYKLKPRNALKRRVKAIIMTFILVALVLFLVLVPVFGSTIFDIIKEITGAKTLVLFLQEFLHILKYPLILLVLYLGVRLMYVIAPDQEIPTRTTRKGSVFTTVGWILATEIFAFYIEKFTKYDVFYGSLSNILVLLLWVYLLSYIYVFGMIINASDYNKELSESE